MSTTVTVNLEEMAERLRISLPTMRKLTRRPGFPVVQEGRNGVPWQLDAEAVIAFVIAEREAEAAAAAERSELLAQISLPMEDLVPPEQANLSASDRLKHAQAMLKEDELARQRGFLVLTSDMRQRLTPAFLKLSQAVLAMPGRWARRYNLPDAVARDMRRDAEQQLRLLHADLRDLLGPEAAPPPDSDAVDA